MSEPHSAYSEDTNTLANEDVLWAVLTEFQRLVAVHCRAAFFSMQAVFESPEQPKNCPGVHKGDKRKEEKEEAAAAAAAAAAAQEEQEKEDVQAEEQEEEQENEKEEEEEFEDEKK